MEEYKNSKTAYFLTFTYEDPPITKNGLWTLKINDFQLYMKALRKRAGAGLKFYAVGEYGPLTLRPHYHVIIFNCSLQSIINSRSLEALRYPQHYLNGKFEYHNTLWLHGHITIGLVNVKSIRYTLKYISKPLTVPLYTGDDRHKEKSWMSKGLGLSYLTPQTIQYHRALPHERLFTIIDGGVKVGLPRYYKEKIFTKYEREKIAQTLRTKEEKEYYQLTEEQKYQKYLEFQKERLNIEHYNDHTQKDFSPYTL